MLGGTTLNAFAGVGRAEGSLDVLIKMASRPEAASRWRRAQTLIIDEVRRSGSGSRTKDFGFWIQGVGLYHE